MAQAQCSGSGRHAEHRLAAATVARPTDRRRHYTEELKWRTTFHNSTSCTFGSTSAERILSSRTKSQIAHKTRDLRASGDEVEIPARDLFREKLPPSYHVGHGHIVD